MKVKLNLDTQRLKEKPQVFDGRLRNRLCSSASIREVTPEELMQAIQEGRTFTPAVMTGTTGDTWQAQQVICADIDNAESRKDEAGNWIRDEKGKTKKFLIDNPIDPDRAADIMREHGIDPYFMYYSFSNAEGWPKFRIVLILDEAITDKAEALDLDARFTGLFNRAEEHSADTTSSDAARLYYGGKPESVFYCSGQITKRAQLQALPAAEDPKQAAEEPKRPKTATKPQTEYKRPAKPQNAGKRTFDELQAQLRQDIETFNLAEYVQATTGSRPVKRGRALFFNPCPVCGHNDDFQVTGALYHCHSASGGTGGTIIDYLINREDIGRADALEKFKYDIMRYDRDEWKRAYREMKQDEEIQAAIDADIEAYNEYLQTPEGQAEQAEVDAYWAAGGADPGRQQAEEAGKAGEETPPEPKKDKLQAFFEKIQTDAYKPHETGLQFFDALLGGGVMQQSLLIVMAPPGTGKTTICQQIAEEMAARETRLIYLNFEMSDEQMLAKALSYRLAKEGRRLTSDEILKGYNWTETPRERVTRAYNEYREGPAKFIYYESGVTPTLDALQAYLTKTGEAAKKNGEDAPAIVADYLQLITGEGDNEAKTVKAAITMLKDYAIKYNTFVICIAAINRESAKAGRITLESARDSSGVEYTGDYVISLQYYDIDQEIADGRKPGVLSALQLEPWRRLIIRVLKHRLGGGVGKSAKVYYNAAYNYFVGEKQSLPNWPERDLKSRNPFAPGAAGAAAPDIQEEDEPRNEWQQADFSDISAAF